ncbi:acyltransferase domain-containing protein, partial [Streptomyces sp. NPDC002669]|uniref:acyltransferase domain-containing protein n=1 Tax=Streptomyces sp. NPDC002669 TaxID=3364658 RepID=UPI003684D2C4
LEDACTLVTARGRLMQAARPGGAMAAIAAPETEITEHLASYEGRVSVAAVNGPAAVVVSGDTDAVTEITDHFREQNTRTKRLTVSHAFHSPHMDTAADAFEQALTGITFHEPTLTVISNLTGAEAEPGTLTTPAYWARHIRAAVRFHDGITTLHTRGTTTYLELGPDPVLTSLTQNILDAPTAVAALRTDHDEATTLLRSLATLHVHGITTDLSPLLAGRTATPLELPTYPFQHEEFWLHPTPRTDLTTAGLTPTDHPLLTAAIDLADTGHLILTGRLTPTDHPWLTHHTIAGTTLLPGTAFVDLALHTAHRTNCTTIEELTLETPLPLTDQPLHIQTVAGPPNPDGTRTLTIQTRPETTTPDNTPWTRHATGTLTPHTPPTPTPPTTPWPPTHATPINLTHLYPNLTHHGYTYGPAFQGLTHLWQHHNHLYAQITLPPHTNPHQHPLHPALLDAALHPLLATTHNTPTPHPDTPIHIPFTWHNITLHTTHPTTLRAHLTTTTPTT